MDREGKPTLVEGVVERVGFFRVLRGWPSDRWIPGQLRIDISPEKDEKLKEFLKVGKRVVAEKATAGDEQSIVMAACQYVFENVKYDPDFMNKIRKTFFPKKLGEFTEGGICTTKALFHHCLLAYLGIESRVRYSTPNDHAVVEVPSVGWTSDPTWNINQYTQEFPDLKLYSEKYKSRPTYTLQHVKPS